MAGNKDNVAKAITAGWLKKYIDETQKYDALDWYLALSSRKKIYDYLSWFYNHSHGWLLFTGHKTFSSPSVLARLTHAPMPLWMRFIFRAEENLGSFITFQKEYPTPDEYKQNLKTQQFRIIDFLDENSLRVLVITPGNSCREYIAIDNHSVLFMYEIFSDETYNHWVSKNYEISEIEGQIRTLSEKIKSGEILKFSEADRTRLSPLIQYTLPPSVTTLSQGDAFYYIERLKKQMGKVSVKTKHPNEPDINWNEVQLKDMFWEKNDEKTSVLAEINLLKSDTEITGDFMVWLKKIRQELNTPSLKREKDTTPTIEVLTQTLTLAYIDFKIFEFANKIKKPESFFSGIVSDLSPLPGNIPFELKYKEQVKGVAVKAMSDSFLNQLANQAFASSSKKAT